MVDLLDSTDLALRYALDEPTATMLARYGFDAGTFERLRSELAGRGLDPRANWVEGDVRDPEVGDLRPLPPAGSGAHEALRERGATAIESGEVAVLLLAGGMATRFGGGVKALAEVLPGFRFLDVKVADLAQLTEHLDATVPLTLMTSFQSDEPLAAAAAELATERVPIHLAPQSISMRVNEQGELYRSAEGSVSLYAPGHGDVPEALKTSGVFDQLRAQGCRQLFVTNVDNVAATLDPAMIGLHLAEGRQMTCEVTGGDLNGGAPFFVDGHLQILEEFRIPAHIDTAAPLAVNTNSLVIELDALAPHHPLTWFQVQKKVDGDPVVQFERLVGELSAFVSTTMAVVPRDGASGRFQPVKDPAELERRQPEIRRILTARGVI